MAIQPCEALKKIRDALGQPMTAEDLASQIYNACEKHGMPLLKRAQTEYATPGEFKDALRNVAAEVLTSDAAETIRAILDEVDASLPMQFRKLSRQSTVNS